MISWRAVCLASLSVPLLPLAARAGCGDAAEFAAQAALMRDQAIAAGDQPYGAVIVVDGCIAGHGPSRVVVDSNPNAHAERVALQDAQSRLGRMMLAGAVIYSTSIPCMICQPALAAAGVTRMFVGPEAIDEGMPRMG